MSGNHAEGFALQCFSLIHVRYIHKCEADKSLVFVYRGRIPYREVPLSTLQYIVHNF